MSLFGTQSLKLRIAKVAILCLGIASFLSPSVYTVVNEHFEVRYEQAEAAETAVLIAQLAQQIMIAYRAYGSMVLQQAMNAMQWAMKYKEFVLDGIAWYAAKLIIRQITNEIVQWINNGFEGAPGFVTDFDGFIRNVADRTIGHFIEGGDLAFLCDPFEFEIKFALRLRYAESGRFHERSECTFSGVFGNVEGAFDHFVSGDFISGGWSGWFSLTQNRQNNPYGAFAMAQTEAEIRMGRNVANAKWEVDLGKGFVSWTTCPEGSDRGTDGACYNELSGEQIPHKVNTPGSLIEDQLATTFGSDVRSLELADELNEILSALGNLLISKIFSERSEGGLRGSSEEDYESYINEMQDLQNTETLANNGQTNVNEGMQGRENELFDPEAGDALEQQISEREEEQRKRDEAANDTLLLCLEQPSHPLCTLQGEENPGNPPGSEPEVPPPPGSDGLPDLSPPPGEGENTDGGPGPVPPPPPPPPPPPTATFTLACGISRNDPRIDWAAEISGGTGPFQIAWSAQDVLGNPIAPDGATTAQVIARYQDGDRITASVTATDATGATLTVPCEQIIIENPPQEQI